MEAPKDDLVRAVFAPGRLELRTDGEGGMPTLFGHFLRFNEWTEIHSWYEGDFLEQIAPGACAKTIAERGDAIKCLYDHGYDPSIGNKVLGPFIDLREDGKVGGYYEVQLLDTSYVRDLVPGLEASLYGASFRFQVVKEMWNDEPGISAANPKGLPERTILELRLFELGPVTFPAYQGATAGVRSMTDTYIEQLLRTNPTAAARLAERAAEISRTPETTGADADASGTPEAEGAARTTELEPVADHSAVTHAQRTRALRLEGVIQ